MHIDVFCIPVTAALRLIRSLCIEICPIEVEEVEVEVVKVQGYRASSGLRSGSRTGDSG